MVEDTVDPMSVPMAVTHFHPEVERIMIENRDFQAASLCHEVRNWWRSEDEPGIPSLERVKMRIDLRKRLLDNIDFGKFPPNTQYVKGWPLQLWEALIANIDAKCFLYSLTKTGSYNTRAFSTMMGETFFSEVANQDKRGTHGTLTSKEFSHFMATSVEQMNIRLDKRRSFTYRTSRSSVYKLVENEDSLLGDETTPIMPEIKPPHMKWLDIKARDHFFDSMERKSRVSGYKPTGTVSTKRNAIQKGSLGVRWEKARVNESNILPTRRMGIDDQT